LCGGKAYRGSRAVMWGKVSRRCREGNTNLLYEGLKSCQFMHYVWKIVNLGMGVWKGFLLEVVLWILLTCTHMLHREYEYSHTFRSNTACLRLVRFIIACITYFDIISWYYSWYSKQWCTASIVGLLKCTSTCLNFGWYKICVIKDTIAYNQIKLLW